MIWTRSCSAAPATSQARCWTVDHHRKLSDGTAWGCPAWQSFLRGVINHVSCSSFIYDYLLLALNTCHLSLDSYSNTAAPEGRDLGRPFCLSHPQLLTSGCVWEVFTRRCTCHTAQLENAEAPNRAEVCEENVPRQGQREGGRWRRRKDGKIETKMQDARGQKRGSRK